MLGKVDFKEDGKFCRENGWENVFMVCLVGWGGRKKKRWGPGVFSQGPPQNFLPKMGIEKTGGGD